MGILQTLGIGDLGGAVAAPIDAIGNLIGKVYTTDGEKLSAQEMLERLRQNPQLWQADTNKIDAASDWWFQRGWRPSYGWVGSISLFFYFVPQYIIASILWTITCLQQHNIVPFPVSATPVLELAGLLLGIYGTHRTIEKITGKD